jgi:glycosyltransferase involved in cell wall biosynthesis
VSAAGHSTVAVVIPCFGQARFLAGALDSVLRQTHAAAELVVVDDGGDEDLSPILSSYPTARLIRQENRGLAGARNRGLREVSADKVIFLDADDRLFPSAIEAGLKCFDAHRDAAFVFGRFAEQGPGGVRIRDWKPIDRLDLIRCNWVAMIGAVMFDRAKLVNAGGFDESLAMCEDWDAYLRLSRDHSFAGHEEVVALYQRHAGNMSGDAARLRSWIDEVRTRERDRGLSLDEARAWREGEHVWDRFYGSSGSQSLIRRAHRKLARTLSGLAP